MVRIYFKNHQKLAEYMHIKAEDGLYITATLFIDDTVALLRELLSAYEDIKVESVNIVAPEYNDYNDEYYVSLSESKELNIEPAKVEGRYLIDAPDIMLLHGDVNSSILQVVDAPCCKEISIGEELSYRDFQDFVDSLYSKDYVTDSEMINILMKNAKLETDSKGVPAKIVLDLDEINNEI